jgi:uncharacterized surface protein with fasciclin (FAS1) repeats
VLNFWQQITTDKRGMVTVHFFLYGIKDALFFFVRQESLMKRFFAAVASVIALLCHAPYALAADLVETASTSGSFKTFLAAAKAAGLTDKLKESGPYTVFAPDDAAFNKLPPGKMESLMKNKAKLAEILSHHIIPGKVTVADVKPGKVATLQGGEITLTSDNGKVTVDNANVIQSDLMADNGVIHEIDLVVLPDE